MSNKKTYQEKYPVVCMDVINKKEEEIWKLKSIGSLNIDVLTWLQGCNCIQSTDLKSDGSCVFVLEDEFGIGWSKEKITNELIIEGLRNTYNKQSRKDLFIIEWIINKETNQISHIYTDFDRNQSLEKNNITVENCENESLQSESTL
jgi:hypothetical protein